MPQALMIWEAGGQAPLVQVLGWMGAPHGCSSRWTYQVFLPKVGRQEAGAAEESSVNLFRWRPGLESALGLAMAAAQPEPGEWLLIVPIAGGLLMTREEGMKRRGGT